MHSHTVCNTTLAAGVAVTLLLAGCTPQGEEPLLKSIQSLMQ
jgi:outer membrane murein-binding lipoprotein Lpp